MQPEPGRPSDPRGDALLPPATTRWQPLPDADDEAALPLAPFLPGRPGPAAASPATPEPLMPWEEEESPAEPQPEPAPLDFEPGPPALLQLEPEAAALPDFEPPGDSMPWLATAQEPAAAEADTGSDFPLDAFFIPEGVGSSSAPDSADGGQELAVELARRLEALAAQLRESGFAALFQGDRTSGPDDLLAALVSGYLAARPR